MSTTNAAACTIPCPGAHGDPSGPSLSLCPLHAPRTEVDPLPQPFDWPVSCPCEECEARKAVLQATTPGGGRWYLCVTCALDFGAAREHVARVLRLCPACLEPLADGVCPDGCEPETCAVHGCALEDLGAHGMGCGRCAEEEDERVAAMFGGGAA